MEKKGAEEKLLKCLPNVNADIGFESLFKVDINRGKKLDTGNKSEFGIKTRQCKCSLEDKCETHAASL